MRQITTFPRPVTDACGLLLACGLALGGCTTGPAKNDARPDAISVSHAETVDSKVRAEFEAAMKLMNAGELAKGIELMTRLTEHAKSNTAPFINLAIAHEKLGNHAAAEENLKKALELNADHPVANNEYGLLYRKTGRFAEARKAYERTLEKSPHFLPARKNLAILCDLYLRDLECALKHYQLYGQAMPSDKAVDIWIADLKTRLGR